jgi:predicted nucleic acid-binding Zn ribbon protein
MAVHRRAPRSLADALGPLRASLAPQTLMAEAQAAWPGVVGPLITQEATPVSERAGTLTVRCSAAVWAQELELMSGDILERLNAALERGRITALRCVIS